MRVICMPRSRNPAADSPLQAAARQQLDYVNPVRRMLSPKQPMHAALPAGCFLGLTATLNLSAALPMRGWQMTCRATDTSQQARASSRKGGGRGVRHRPESLPTALKLVPAMRAHAPAFESGGSALCSSTMAECFQAFGPLVGLHSLPAGRHAVQSIAQLYSCACNIVPLWDCKPPRILRRSEPDALPRAPSPRTARVALPLSEILLSAR